MKPENRRIFYIVALITIVVLAIVLGLVFGLKSSGNEEKPETPVPQPDPEPKEEEIDVLNLYNNTAELIKKFPVINNTTVISGTIEEKIQNRLLTGFENIEDSKHGKLGVIYYTRMILYIMFMVPDYL